MTLYKEKAKSVLDPNTEIHYAIRTSYKDAKFPHSHDFYEVSLIIKGKQRFIINERKIVLQEGSLILIRPKDIHSREYMGEGMHINVAFPQKTANELFNYLGEGFKKDLLLNSELPPCVVLNSTEKEIVQRHLKELNLIQVYDTQTIRTRLRIVLFELLTNYFTNINIKKSDLPFWLALLVMEMKKKENFTRGVPSLVEISGKSHEYLCRSFKKYLNTTPTRFINEQRLNYIANLLIYSDMEIVDICFESGLDNLSHFYRIFKEKFNTTPADYREQMATNQFS